MPSPPRSPCRQSRFSGRGIRSGLAQRGALALGSLAVSLLLAEAAWRTVLASDTPRGVRLRNPTLYADPFSDDLFWLLRHRWQGRFEPFQPPKHVDPLLGWRNAYIGADFSHHDEGKIAGRRPVLLYGDSFAQGYQGVEPFQKILNGDEAFADHHYLLNYGVGGYGLDQIYLMFRHSVDRFDDPFVVFSVMTFDLDRSVLSIRIGQKPYFEVVSGELALRGVPIDSDPEHYFSTHPPRPGSYIWQRLGRLLWRAGPDGTARLRAHKKEVNGAILDAAIGELEARRLDYVILVFHASKAFRNGPDWRSTWLRSKLDDHGARYLWSYDILRHEAGDRPVDDLFDPRNVHPTTLANRIIARAIADEAERARRTSDGLRIDSATTRD
jgi:hypothetical protein